MLNAQEPMHPLPPSIFFFMFGSQTLDSSKNVAHNLMSNIICTAVRNWLYRALVAQKSLLHIGVQLMFTTTTTTTVKLCVLSMNNMPQASLHFF